MKGEAKLTKLKCKTETLLCLAAVLLTFISVTKQYWLGVHLSSGDFAQPWALKSTETRERSFAMSIRLDLCHMEKLSELQQETSLKSLLLVIISMFRLC